MAKWFRNFLDNRDLNGHLTVAIVLGLAMRVLCAFFVYGPQALDDYKHGLLPAYQMHAGLPVELPDYRSPLLNWFLAGALKVGHFLGIETPLAQVQWMLLFLGLFSMLGVVGAYLFAAAHKEQRFGKILIYLTALHALMPFLSTRAFGESVACALVLLAAGLIEYARVKQSLFSTMFLGFWVLGLATLLRFHVGVLFVTLLMFFAFEKRWKFLLAGVLAGLVTLAEQAGVDAANSRPWLGTIWTYLAENQGGGAKYGEMPWYNTWMLALGLLLIPWSLLFGLRTWGKTFQKHWRWAALIFVFVLAHSLAAHKEERFLYPIVGLMWILLAAAWSSAFDQKRVRLWFTPLFLLLTAVGLFVTCFNNTQSGEIEPLAYIGSHYPRATLLDRDSLVGPSRVKALFLRPPMRLEAAPKGDISVLWMEDVVKSHPESEAVAVLTSDPDIKPQLEALSGFKTETMNCEKIREASSMVDAWIYAMNPRHNQRRRPTWYLICKHPKGIQL